MRSIICGVLLLMACCWSPAAGWGFIFNRFRPEANLNWGYGAAGQQVPMSERLVSQRDQLMEAMLAEELLEEQLCEGRRCTSNENCCSGHVCDDFDGASGTCMAALGQLEGAECRGDFECAAGLVCDVGSCVQIEGKKRYSQACRVSSECAIESGLCCKVVRRHRQAPKTMCTYFKDPMTCLGHVDTQQVQHVVEHTKGEKRLTGKTLEYGNNI